MKKEHDSMVVCTKKQHDRPTTVHHVQGYYIFYLRSTTGPLKPGGMERSPQILPDQLTISQSEGADYAHHIILCLLVSVLSL